jgi:phosphoribosylaminoimidazole-succinocarboxamide synthase
MTDINSLVSTNLFFKKQKNFTRGKVRDVYNIADELLVLVASDRISAFDQVLPRPIPYKGQVLNQIASRFLDETAHLVPNWKISEPDPHVTIGHKCNPFPVEIVVRGFLAGHAWRVYQSGLREICGVRLPEGLRENDPLPAPILTPTTKSKDGHDEDVSLDEIKNQKLLKKKQIDQIEAYALSLFDYGQKRAESRNLILVDTKYEFGELNDQILLIDEIHTPDSSRYFYNDTYEQIQSKDQQQRQLSKEFVRKWLIENGFQGRDGELVPYMSDEYIESVSLRYIELYEQITGEGFQRRDYTHISEVIENRVNEFISAHLS